MSTFNRNFNGNNSVSGSNYRVSTQSELRPITENQIVLLKELFSELKKVKQLPEALAMPCPKNMQEASDTIVKWSKEVPMLTKTNNNLNDMVRFRVITEGDIADLHDVNAGCITEFNASEFVKVHKDKYYNVSYKKCTLAQAKKINELETKLAIQPMTDFFDSAHMTIDRASSYISELSQMSYKKTFDDAFETKDDSRSRDNDEINGSYELQERNREEALYIALSTRLGNSVARVGYPDFDNMTTTIKNDEGKIVTVKADIIKLNQEMIDKITLISIDGEAEVQAILDSIDERFASPSVKPTKVRARRS